MSFKGKVAIVTGSSSGIGRAAVEQLATEGASVTVHGKNTARLQETLDLLKKQGVPESRIHSVQGSIEDEDVQKQLIDETVKKFGKLDVLVNNAGAVQKSGLGANDLKNFDFVINVNLRSVIALTLLAVPHLEKTKGNIVNISSIGAKSAWTSATPYVLTKAGLDHYTNNACAEYASKGIRVNTVSPGPIHTNIAEAGNYSKEYLDAMEKMIPEKMVPLRRWGEPDDVANVITFLASDKASFVTGANVAVDGGTLVGRSMT
ncbi:hypothetical protein M3Y97_00641500 [Aphelenchoides bicaudatus]|nr:hypothetical protein M3Y97_00641500 [Aphelenchoides bicaudatus]